MSSSSAPSHTAGVTPAATAGGKKDAELGGSDRSSGSGSDDSAPHTPTTAGPPPADGAGAAIAVALKKKNKSLSARALRLFKSSLRRSTSSARTVLTSTPSCGDASSCASGASFRLGGLGSAIGVSSSSKFGGDGSSHHRIGGDDGDDDYYYGVDGPAISHDCSADSEGTETGLTDPEAVKRARALHDQGRRRHAGRRYHEAVALHAEALEEMGGKSAAEAAARPDERGCCAGTEADLLRARIAHDLARARYSLATSSSPSTSGGEENPRRLADEARSARRAMHRSMASHLERRAAAFRRPEKEEDDNKTADAVDDVVIANLSDDAAKADLLRAAARLRDEKLFEYDSALRCYGAALALEVRAMEELDGQMAASASGQRGIGVSQVGGNNREARKLLEARVEETRRMIGRIHYKRGQFGMAVRTTLGG